MITSVAHTLSTSEKGDRGQTVSPIAESQRGRFLLLYSLLRWRVDGEGFPFLSCAFSSRVSLSYGGVGRMRTTSHLIKLLWLPPHHDDALHGDIESRWPRLLTFGRGGEIRFAFSL